MERPVRLAVVGLSTVPMLAGSRPRPLRPAPGPRMRPPPSRTAPTSATAAPRRSRRRRNAAVNRTSHPGHGQPRRCHRGTGSPATSAPTGTMPRVRRGLDRRRRRGVHGHPISSPAHQGRLAPPLPLIGESVARRSIQASSAAPACVRRRPPIAWPSTLSVTPPSTCTGTGRAALSDGVADGVQAAPAPVSRSWPAPILHAEQGHRDRVVVVHREAEGRHRLPTSTWSDTLLAARHLPLPHEVVGSEESDTGSTVHGRRSTTPTTSTTRPRRRGPTRRRPPSR